MQTVHECLRDLSRLPQTLSLEGEGDKGNRTRVGSPNFRIKAASSRKRLMIVSGGPLLDPIFRKLLTQGKPKIDCRGDAHFLGTET